MNILITGGAGFIGSHVADALLQKGHNLTIFDNLSSGKKMNIPTEATFIEGNICDQALVQEMFRQHSFDAVFHFAAQINVRVSVDNPLADAKTNISGALTLLEACRETGVKKFIFSSTGGVMYGDTTERPTPETHLACPISPYGISKLTIDNYANFYRDQGLQVVSLRYGNVYGPRQNPHGEAGVVAIFLEKMLSGVTPVINGDGEQTRDYVFVEDIVNANLLALESTESTIYNIGTGQETSVNEIFSALNAHFKNSFTAQYGPAKAGELLACSLDANKANQELGWSAKTSLTEGLQKTYTWFKNNF